MEKNMQIKWNICVFLPNSTRPTFSTTLWEDLKKWWKTNFWILHSTQIAGNSNICKCRRKATITTTTWKFCRFNMRLCCSRGPVRVRVRVRHVLRPQPFRSTALDFDCESDFESDTDSSTRTNDAALFAYAIDRERERTPRKGCPERVNRAGLLSVC